MKKSQFFRLLKMLIIVAMFVVGLLLYDKLPAIVPIHRNAQGVVNGYWSKLTTLIWLPIAAIVLVVLFYFLPKLDPRKQNYPAFAAAWEVLQVIILWFFAYIYFITLYAVLHPSIAIMSFILWWVGVLFIVLGAAMRHVKSNYFIGIRTPWALENDVVRDKTHKVGSLTFMLAWIVMFANAFRSAYFVPIFVIVLILCIGIPVVYSYVVYRRLK